MAEEQSAEEQLADSTSAPAKSATLHGALLSGTYNGDYLDGRFHGQGVYVLNEKQRYVGEFFNGEFHGEGTLHVEGGKWQGTWKQGQLVKGAFVMPDGLAYREVDKKYWLYCSIEDPRFYKEIKDGVKLGDPLKYDTAHGETTPRLPPGCYDTIEGYYDPRKLSICSRDTQEPVRMVDREEKEWIIRSCRVQT